MKVKHLFEDVISTLKNRYVDEGDTHRINVFNDSGAVGYIQWDKDSGEVEKVFVGQSLRRQGIATHLWELAVEWARDNNEEEPQHSSRRTKSGDEFAKSIGGYIPDLTDDIDGWTSRD